MPGKIIYTPLGRGGSPPYSAFTAQPCQDSQDLPFSSQASRFLDNTQFTSGEMRL